MPQAPTIAPEFIQSLGLSLPGVQMIPVNGVPLEPFPEITPFELTLPNLRGEIAALQSICIDNLANDCDVIIANPRTQQIVIAPPRSWGWYPLFIPSPPQLRFTMRPARASLLTATINIVLCNTLISQGPIFSAFDASISQRLSESLVTINVAGDTTIIPGIALQSARVHRMMLTIGGATNITFRRDATALTGVMPFFGGGSIMLDFTDRPWFETGAGEDFILNSSAAVSIGGRVDFFQGA